MFSKLVVKTVKSNTNCSTTEVKRLLKKKVFIDQQIADMQNDIALIERSAKEFHWTDFLTVLNDYKNCIMELRTVKV